jgi:aminopeptidase N
MKRQLATALVDDWQWAFDAHQVSGGYSPDPVSAGRRCARQPRLAMLCMAARQSGDAVWPGRAWQRFKDAGNMTDRQGALMALMASGSVLADAAFERFHAIFRNDALVARQVVRPAGRRAGARGQGVRAGEAPARPPDFKLANPNRARSLIGTFCLGNPAGFHRADGAGYAFWADRVIALDAINPQAASRIARALDRWSHLAEPYRSAARAAIERVEAQPKLSDDTHEIVSRALAGA